MYVMPNLPLGLDSMAAVKQAIEVAHKIECRCAYYPYIPHGEPCERCKMIKSLEVLKEGMELEQ